MGVFNCLKIPPPLEDGNPLFQWVSSIVPSWEGFALEQVLHLTGLRNVYFWATYGGAELDLLTFEGGRRIGYEFKCWEAPRVTKSMRIARQDLRLDELRVVYPGLAGFPLDDGIAAVALPELAGSARQVSGDDPRGWGAR